MVYKKQVGKSQFNLNLISEISEYFHICDLFF